MLWALMAMAFIPSAIGTGGQTFVVEAETFDLAGPGWHEFTRNIPPGQYWVFAKYSEFQSSSEISPGALAVAGADSALQPLGDFKPMGPGPWSGPARTPLVNAGSPVALEISGQATFRYSANYGALDYLEFIPATRPAVLLNQTSIGIRTGGMLGLAALAYGEGPFTYQWQRNGIDLPGKTQLFLSLSNLVESASGEYRVIVSNGHGSDSPSARVSVFRQISRPHQVTSRTISDEGSFGAGGPTEHEYRFDGTAGETLTFEESGAADCANVSWSLFAPDGTRLFANTLGAGCVNDPTGTRILPQTGAYRLVIARTGAAAEYSFRIAEPVVLNASLQLGQQFSTAFTGHGQSMSFDLEVPSAQKVEFRELTGECTPAPNGLHWALADPNGQMLFLNPIRSRECFGDQATTILDLAPGTYKIKTAPGVSLIPFSFTVESVPVQTHQISLGQVVAPDQPVTGAGRTSVPGEVDTYQFAGTQGQQVTLYDLPNNSQCLGTKLQLRAPSGGLLLEQIIDDNCSGGEGPSQLTLPENGAYSITVSTPNGGTGTHSFGIEQARLLAHYQLNGDALDASGNAIHGQISGTTPANDRHGAAGKALQFNGTSDLVYCGTTNDFNFAGGYTLSAWVKLSSPNLGKFVLSKLWETTAQLNPPGYSYGLGLAHFQNTTNGQAGSVATGFVLADSQGAQSGSGGRLDQNEWRHLAMTIGSVGRLYVNGAKVAEWPIRQSERSKNRVPLMIGATASGLFFEGAIDDARVHNYPLSGAEVGALWEADLVRVEEPPVQSDAPVAHYRLDGTAQDASGSALHGVLTGTTPTADRYGAAAGAMLFNGVSDKISCGDKAEFEFSSGFTLSVWVKMSAPQNGRYIIGKYDVHSIGGVRRAYGLGTAYSDPYGFVRGDGSGYEDFRAVRSWVDGKWHAWALVAKPGAEMRLYVDGEKIAERSIGAYPKFDNTAALTIGAIDSGAHFAGALDDVRIYNRAVSEAEVQAMFAADTAGIPPEPGPLPVSTEPIAVYLLDGTAEDSSGNDFDGVIAGTAPMANRRGEANKALMFNGTSDRIDCGNLPAFNFAGGFTLSAWIKLSGDQSERYIVGKYNVADPVGRLNAFGMGIAYSDLYGFVSGSEPGYQDQRGARSIADGKWHAVAMVANPGAEMFLYLDGSLLARQPMRNYSRFLNQTPLTIGSIASGAHFGGGIDDVRIYNRPLSASEILAAFAADSAGMAAEPEPPAASATPVAHYPLDGNAQDASGNNLHGALLGPTPTADRKGAAGGALQFNGTTDRIDCGNPPAFNFAGSFTLSAWVKLAGEQREKYIIGKYNTAASAGRFNAYGLGTANSDLYGFVSNSGGTYEDQATGRVLADGKWHAIAMVANSAEELIFYLDGTKVSSRRIGLYPRFSNAQPLTIGAIASGANFGGAIDDVRIYNRALGALEIKTVYDQDAQGNAPDPRPPEPSIPPIAHYPLDGSANDSGPNQLHGTLVGTAPAADRYGNASGSRHFNGTSDMIDCGNSPAFNFTGGFTLSAWINMAGDQYGRYIVGKYDHLGSLGRQQAYGLGIAYSDLYGFVSPAGPGYEDHRTGHVLSDGQWHAVAMRVSPGQEIAFYIDGAKVSTRPIGPYSQFANPVPLTIGSIASGAHFAGKIDDVRIYNRDLPDIEIQAVYAKDIEDIPPEAEPPAVSQTPIAHYRLDGNAQDASGNNLHGAMQGCSLAPDRYGVANKALRFDGGSDKIDCGNPPAFNFPAGFTLSAWVRIADLQAGSYIVGKYKPSFDPARIRSYGMGLADSDLYGFVMGDGPGYQDTRTGVSLVDGSWHAVAMVATPGVELALFVDGLKVASRPIGDYPRFSNLAPLTIGSIAAGGHFKGWLDDVRIYNRPLGALEIAEQFSTDKQGMPGIPDALPPSQTPVAHYRLDGGAQDSSANAFHGVVTGTTPTADRYGAAGGALLFDGDKDRIDCGNPGAFNFDGGFTLSAWIKFKDLPFGRYFLGKYDHTGGAGRMRAYAFGIANEDLYGAITGTDPGYEDLQTSRSLADDRWHAVAMVVDPAAPGSTSKLYVDGTLAATRTISVYPRFLNHLSLTIGAIDSGLPFRGAIDDVRIYNRPISESDVKSAYDLDRAGMPPEPEPPAPSQTPVAHYRLNGDGSDASGNGLHGVMTGAIPVPDRHGNPGSALYFDGSEARIDCGNPPAFNFSSAFTLSAWVMMVEPRPDGFVLRKLDPFTSAGRLYSYSFGTVGEGLRVQLRGNAETFVIDTSSSIVDAQWRYLAMVAEPGTGLRIYVDGQLARVESLGNFPRFANSAPLIVGDHFKGALDEVRIYNRALPAIELEAIYAAEKPVLPPLPQPWAVSQDPVAHYRLDGDAQDASGNGLHGLLQGAAPAPDRFGQTNKALRFSGLGERIDCGNSGAFNFASGFTLSAWMRAGAAQSSYLIAKYDPRNSAGRANAYGLGLAGSGLYGFASNSSGQYADQRSAMDVMDDAWHAVALVVAPNGAMRLYRDGFAVATLGLGAYPPFQNRLPLMIGGDNSGGGFSGSLDEVRIYNRPLEAPEIKALYDQDRAGMPGEAPEPPVLAPIAHYPLDGTAVEIEGGYHGTVRGTVPIADRFGNPSGALEFDGVDDRIDCGNPAAFNFTSAFTLSAWVRLNGAQSARYVLSKYEPGGPDATRLHSYGLGLNNSNPYGFVMGNGPGYRDIDAGPAISDDEWHSLTLVAAPGNALRIYLDGQFLHGWQLSAQPPFQNAAPLLIGATVAGHHFGGAIDDVRIFDRALTSNEIFEMHAWDLILPAP